jgi:hypothetical protein
VDSYTHSQMRIAVGGFDRCPLSGEARKWTAGGQIDEHDPTATSGASAVRADVARDVVAM